VFQPCVLYPLRFAKSSVPLVVIRTGCRSSVRCSVLQRSYRTVGETDAYVLYDHVGRQKLLKSDHAVPRSAVERIAHGPGVRITGVKDTTVARCVVASLPISLSVRHLLMTISSGIFIINHITTVPLRVKEFKHFYTLIVSNYKNRRLNSIILIGHLQNAGDL